MCDVPTIITIGWSVTGDHPKHALPLIPRSKRISQKIHHASWSCNGIRIASWQG